MIPFAMRLKWQVVNLSFQNSLWRQESCGSHRQANNGSRSKRVLVSMLRGNALSGVRRPSSISCSLPFVASILIFPYSWASFPSSKKRQSHTTTMLLYCTTFASFLFPLRDFEESFWVRSAHPVPLTHSLTQKLCVLLPLRPFSLDLPLYLFYIG